MAWSAACRGGRGVEGGAEQDGRIVFVRDGGSAFELGFIMYSSVLLDGKLEVHLYLFVVEGCSVGKMKWWGRLMK